MVAGLHGVALPFCEAAADVAIVVRCIVIDVSEKQASRSGIIVIAADVEIVPLFQKPLLGRGIAFSSNLARIDAGLHRLQP